ncbi:MAG: N-6 DNA methylase, partial [Phycisphaerales bacterium]|nr:N-6 DNA methylase [Phycisphaerales bacterium]
KWNRSAWESDPWDRNFLGTPPQGRADYAFFQHILKSMDPKTGRSAVLFPHGVLFRNEEADMRRKLVESDLIECVLGLGPGLFYNSPMEACVVICRSQKPKARKGKILFIDAVAEIARERAQSFLRLEHQQRILKAYQSFADVPGLAAVAALPTVLANDAKLSLPLYVSRPKSAVASGAESTLSEAWAEFDQGGREFWRQMDALVDMLDGVVAEEAGDA